VPELQLHWLRQRPKKLSSYICVTLLHQVQEGNICDESPKTAGESNTKILAEVHGGFNYITYNVCFAVRVLMTC